MPGPVQAYITTAHRLGFNIEPAYNAAHSLVLLTKEDHHPGLGEWVTRTLAALSADERHTHELVMIGLHYATLPDRSWPSFPAYLDHLASVPPISLRDKLLEAYLKLPPCESVLAVDLPDSLAELDLAATLASSDTYINFLRQRFDSSLIDEELEDEAYRYVMDPPAMQDLIVAHLRHMWEQFLASEWERVQPMLDDAVRAFKQVDYARMDNLEAVAYVTGQEPDDYTRNLVAESEQIIFIPNAHIGPYLGRFLTGKTLRILFGARLPEGVRIHAPDLSRNEILIRLGALADDTRLRILKLVSEQGELRSQDIMEALDLSQSASSRHLKQLSATGFITERRCESAKCYQLNPQRVDATLNAVATFLMGT